MAQRAIELVGPHGFIHGWIKVGGGAHDDLKRGMAPHHAAAVTDAMDKAHAARTAGNHRLAAAHLENAMNKARYAPGDHGRLMKSLRAARDEQHGMASGASIREAQKYASFLPPGVSLSEATKAQLAAAIRKGRAAGVTMANGQAAISLAMETPPVQRAASRDDTEAIDLAAMTARRLPLVRGTADLQASRSAPGTVMVRHRSTGLKIGTVESAGGEHTPVHASGAKGPASSSVPGAMAGLIKMHNKIAKGKTDGGIAEVKGYAGEQEALDFAGAVPVSTPAVTSMDGPRVTSMGGAKKAGKVPAMHPAAVAIYRKLRANGMRHGQALALAKRAMAMHARASAKAA